MPSLLKPIFCSNNINDIQKAFAFILRQCRNYFYAFQNEMNVQTISISVTEFRASWTCFNLRFFYCSKQRRRRIRNKKPTCTHIVQSTSIMEDGKYSTCPNNAQFDPISFIFETFNFLRIGILLDLMIEQLLRDTMLPHCCASLSYSLTHSLTLWSHSLLNSVDYHNNAEKYDIPASYLDPESDWFSNLHTNILNPTVWIHIQLESTISGVIELKCL